MKRNKNDCSINPTLVCLRLLMHLEPGVMLFFCYFHNCGGFVLCCRGAYTYFTLWLKVWDFKFFILSLKILVICYESTKLSRNDFYKFNL